MLEQSRRTPRVTARVISSSGGIGIAEIGPVCAVIWRDGVVQSRFDQQYAALAEVVQKYPGKAGFICIIEPTARPPDDKLRRASTEMILSHGDRLTCVAGVIEGSGFRAAATRSALSTITMFVRNRKAPISYFSTVTAGIGWMAQHMQIDSVAQTEAEIERLRSMLGPPEDKWS